MVVLVFSQLITFKHALRLVGDTFHFSMRINKNNAYLYSTQGNNNVKNQPHTTPAETNMSKAMKAYLQRAKAYDDFMKKEEDEYNLGKLHLANMMGVDPANFTQTDIDNAIKYLFPSGLYDKKARPIMKHPKDIFPPKKAAQFDISGRPFHSMFYTTRPNYYKALYDIVEKINILNDAEDELAKTRTLDEDSSSVNVKLPNSEWINKDSLEEKLLEKISVEKYEYFIATFEKLLQHPLSYQVQDFILEFRKMRPSILQSSIIPELRFDETGRGFAAVSNCLRKTSRAKVLVKGQGSGEITINGKPMVQYFEQLQEREQFQKDGLYDNAELR